jgi:glucosamine kinase
LREHYFIGVDGGGTKCKAVLQNHRGQIIGEGLSGSANPATDLPLAIASIVASCELALTHADVPLSQLKFCHVGMGLAGVNLPSINRKMRQWQNPFASVHLTTDLHIACLGAHDGQDGAVIIAGTGSSAFAVVDGNQLILGGHGFTAGDKCGGAWMGRAAAQVCLEAMDELVPYSSLVDLLKTHLNCKDATAVAEKVNGAPAVFFATLAPLVIAAAEQNDVNAVAILQNGAEYLNKLARRLLSHSGERLSMIGGLAPFITPWLDKDIQQRLAKPIHSPDFGALLLAQQQTGVTNSSLLIKKTTIKEAS